jgi:hypothetical protein
MTEARFNDQPPELDPFKAGVKVRFNELDPDLATFEEGVVRGWIPPQSSPDEDQGYLSVDFWDPTSDLPENLWLTKEEAIAKLTLVT